MNADAPVPAGERPALRAEIAIVLLVTFGWSGLYSLVRLVGYHLGPGTGATTVRLNPARSPHIPIDFLLQILTAVQLFAWAALALYLLLRSGIGVADIGFSVRGARSALLRNIGWGTALAALIGLPGLALFIAGRWLGITANVLPAAGGDPGWRMLTYAVIAAGNAVAEEVVVVGYFMTRLRQLGVGAGAAVVASAVLRGSYHLYQGIGPGIGNVVMGLIFGEAYRRWHRLWPLVIAHFVIDVVAYLGYALLASHLTFLG